MCKLIAISSLSCKTLKHASKLVKVTSELLGASQRDGYGYAIQTSDGVFSERYLDPKSVTGMGTLKQSRDMLPATIKTTLVNGVDFDQRGNIPTKGFVNVPFISHGRTATCGKSITNTHPFSGYNGKEQWTIAHNGVVDWSGEALPMNTTCDSEHLLNCYIYKNGEQSFKDHISGYAAITGINPNGELFVLRDNRAPLYIQYVKELASFVVCTDETHCKTISDLMCSFASIKSPTITDTMLISPYTKHTFHADGEVTSVEFAKFKDTLSSSMMGSVYRSLGSAGAVGYSRYPYGYSSPSTTSNYSGSTSVGSGWTDDDEAAYNAYQASTPTTPTTTPASSIIPTTEEVMQDEAEKFRKEQLAKYQKNNRRNHKPWKDTK